MLQYDGEYVRVVSRNGWECVERKNISGSVGVIPVTDDAKLVLIEQYREPLNSVCVELPAGLMDKEYESAVETAERELFEETGYTAERLIDLGSFCVSPGLVDEVITLVLATRLTKNGEGGGVDKNENISVIEIPALTAPSEVYKLSDGGKKIIDCKVFTGIYFAFQEMSRRLGKR